MVGVATHPEGLRVILATLRAQMRSLCIPKINLWIRVDKGGLLTRFISVLIGAIKQKRALITQNFT